jgi:cytochrome P450 family 135
MTMELATARRGEQSAADEHPIEGFPPGPRLPRALQTVLWAARPLQFMQSAQRRYGPVFTVHPYAFGHIVVLADPQDIKQVFTGDRDVFAAGQANAAMSPVLGRHSLQTLDGEHHLHQRKLMLPPFHGEVIGRYRKRVAEITQDEVARWPTGKPFEIRARMQTITFEVILDTVIGVSDSARLARLRVLLPQLLDFSISEMWAVWLFPWLLDTPLGRRNRSLRVRPEVDRLLSEEIAAHRAHPEGHDDILALLVSARDEHDEPLSDENLLDQIITLLLSGHETTATGLAWACERLTRHPEASARLIRELDAGKNAYLDAVVNETLRVRPVIDSVWRKLTAPAIVAGHRLPAGTLVFPAIALVQTSPDAFPDPHEFRPERFLDGSPAPYTFIPFGGGPRRCIGAAFAVMEMKTVLSTMLEHVELAAVDGQSEPPRPRNVTQIPARGARVISTPRQQDGPRGTIPGDGDSDGGPGIMPGPP